MSLTKISETVLSGAFEEQFAFDPATSSGSTFGFTSGTIQGNGLSNTIAAGTVTFTSPSYIYVDWNRVSPRVKSISTTDTLPEHALLLYEVRSLTDMDDYRSWCMATTLRTGEDSSDLVNAPDESAFFGAGSNTFGVAQTTTTADIFTSGNNRAYFHYVILPLGVSVTQVSFGGTSSSRNNLDAATARLFQEDYSNFRVEMWGAFDRQCLTPLNTSTTICQMDIDFSTSTDFSLVSAAITGTDDDIANDISDIISLVSDSHSQTAPFTWSTSSVVGAKATFNAAVHWIAWSFTVTDDTVIASQRAPWVNYVTATPANGLQVMYTQLNEDIGDGAADQTVEITGSNPAVLASLSMQVLQDA